MQATLDRFGQIGSDSGEDAHRYAYLVTDLFDTVHAQMLRHFPELVAELGGDPQDLLRRAGIVAPEATYRQAIHLLELAAAELRCPDLGLRLAHRQGGGGMFGPLGLAMKNSRTFGDALTYVSEHAYAHSLAARIRVTRLADGGLFSAHDILLEGVPVKTQLVEQIILIGHLAALEITGGHARVRRVHFRHQPLLPLRAYRRHFGCEVRFGQNEDGVRFSAADLAAPVVEPDAEAFARVAAFIDSAFPRQRPPLHAEVRGLIMQHLGTGLCTNDSIAAALHLHPRTLHRKLRAEGTAFQKIKDEVRRDMMLYYLQQTRLDFLRISERLGFAEQSVMTRSCQRWFAASPTRMRQDATTA